MMLVSLLSASLALLPAQTPAPASPAPAVTAVRSLDHVTLKAKDATVAAVMEVLKQEGQIAASEIDPAFAGLRMDGEWTGKDWDELLFTALSTLPEMKVLVAGGSEGTEWQVAGGSEQFLSDFKLRQKAAPVDPKPNRTAAAAGQPGTASDPRGVAAEQTVESEEAQKSEEEVEQEQAESLATFTAIVAPPAGPAISGQQIALPFPDASGDVPMATRDSGPIQLPFPGHVAPAAAKGPFPPSSDPALQALIDLVNQRTAQKPTDKR